MIIIDASTALRWFMPAGLHEAEIWRPAPSDLLLAPDLFAWEVRSATLKYVRAEELGMEAAKEMLDIIDRMLPDLTPMTQHKARIWTLACELDHSPYDCVYLALAEHLNAPLITADRRLVGKLQGTAHAARVFHTADWARR